MAIKFTMGFGTFSTGDYVIFPSYARQFAQCKFLPDGHIQACVDLKHEEGLRAAQLQILNASVVRAKLLTKNAASGTAYWECAPPGARGKRGGRPGILCGTLVKGVRNISDSFCSRYKWHTTVYLGCE